MDVRAHLIPDSFCWSKFGVEAGDAVAEIRARKELERRSGAGVFYWGIGTNVSSSVGALIQDGVIPQVLFTPMLSKPAVIDVRPDRVVTWRRGIGMDGQLHEMRGGLVTSRAASDRLPTRHFALVCRSAAPVDVDIDDQYFEAGEFVNYRSGVRVGSSQVTSVVRRGGAVVTGSRKYRVAFRAELVSPFILRLIEPAASSEGGAESVQRGLDLWP